MVTKINLLKHLFTVVISGMLSLAAVLACAQPQEEKILKVGIYEHPPFVMIDGEDFHGFDIDYIETIGLEMGKSVRYTLYKSSNSALKALKSGEVELAIGGLSVTNPGKKTWTFLIVIINLGFRSWSTRIMSRFSKVWCMHCVIGPFFTPLPLFCFSSSSRALSFGFVKENS